MKRPAVKRTLLFLLLFLFLTACAPTKEERLASLRLALGSGSPVEALEGSLALLGEGVSKEAASLVYESLKDIYDTDGALALLSSPLLADAEKALSLYPDESKKLDALLTNAQGLSLYEKGAYEEALPFLKKASSIEAASALADAEEIIKRRTDFESEKALREAEKYTEADAVIASYTDEEAENEKAELLLLEEERLDRLTEYYAGRLGAGAWYTVLLEDGVSLAGDKRYSYDTLPRDAVSVSAGLGAPVFLHADGTVTFFSDTFGQSGDLAPTHVKAVSAGVIHALLLKEDGSVEIAGAVNEDLGAATDWTGITAVSAGAVHSLGLREDGTVAAAGENTSGQCETGDWTDIVSVAAGAFHSAALTKDGRVLSIGDNAYGQCETGGWTGVVRLYAGPFCTIGLTKDRTLLYAGDKRYGLDRMRELKNVVAVAAGPFHAVVITGDGKTHAFGRDDNGQLGLLSGSVPAYPEDPEKLPEFVYVGNNRRGPWLYVSPEGIVLITEDDTYGLGANRADLIAADGTIPLGILAGGGDTPSATLSGPKIARQNNAVFAVSGDYFTYTANANGVQIRRGIIRRDGQKTRSVAFYPDGTLQLVDSSSMRAGELLSRGVKDAWSFGPVLVEDGMLYDFGRHSLAKSGEVTLRSCIGTLGRNHHIVLTTGAGTIREIAELMLSYGCTDAYNLDGGRSVSMVFMGESINRTLFDEYGTRNLQDMIGFLFSDSVPGVNGKYVNRKY